MIQSITTEQLVQSLLAVLAFLPVTVCPGYLAAWYTTLHDFRQRSLVERLFWSVPLSLSLSPIAAVLICRFFSLATAVLFFLFCAVAWLVTLGMEWRRLHIANLKWRIGVSPLGGTALIFAIGWALAGILSLIDLQSHKQLFMSLTIFDHASRVNWTESILRTGVPPANSLYLYKQPAPMRYYYFWNVVCATVAQMVHLSVRCVLIASCVWSGFALAALTGLYLKYFLAAGMRLRKQFLRSIALIAVTGIGICFDILGLIGVPTGNIETSPAERIHSWLLSLLFVPHHIVSMVCCMFAFLLAWIAVKEGGSVRRVSMAFIGAAFASAFGLSIFVLFGFFLLMIAWGIWQVTIERMPRPPLLLTAGGLLATILLMPFLWELTHSTSKMQGGRVFGFFVREMIPPEGLLASPLFQGLAAGHYAVARVFVDLLLLAPGYAIELGFFFLVLLIYLMPGWRGRRKLTPEQRTLVFMAIVTLAINALFGRVFSTTTTLAGG